MAHRNSRPASPRASRGFSIRSAAVLAFLGFSLGLGIALLIVREPTEPLSRERLNSARERWIASGICDYDVTLRMRGVEYSVTVRNGIVMEIASAGVVAQTNDPGAYSIDGVFRVLQQELDAAERFATPPVMRARFNHTLGYPERYIRGSGEMGAAASVEVEQFRPLSTP